MNTPKLFMASLLGLSLLMTGCSAKPGQGAQDATVPHANQTVTLKILAFRSPVLDAELHAFDQTHPTIRVESVKPPVESQTSPSGLIAYQRQAVVAGDVDLTVIMDPQLLDANYLVDVQPWAQKTGFDLKPFGDLDRMKSKGHLFQLPWTVDPQVLVYNQDIFDAAQVAIPKGDWTWDDFRATASKLTQTTGTQHWGFDAEQPEMLLGMYAGGQPERMHDALQFFTTMTFTDKSMPPVPKDVAATHPNRFAAGQAAMTFLPLSRASLTAGSVHWDVASMPHLAGQKAASTLVFQSLGIAAASKHPQEAWELLRFLTGGEGGAVIAASGILPAYRSAAVQDAWFHRQPAPSPGTAALFAMDWLFPKASDLPADEATQKRVADLSVQMTATLRQALSEEGRWEQDFAQYQQLQHELEALTKS